MKTANYTEILFRLDQFLEFCKELALQAEAETARFGVYRERIIQLNGDIERLRAGEDTMTIYKKAAAELPAYFVALAESQEVGGLVSFLRSRPSEEVRPRVKAILAGPELPSEEDHASNQARNIQFELLLAATLWRSGVQVELAEPDLRCKLGDFTVLFACKRLFSKKKLNKRINAATKQLRRNLKNLPQETSAAGIIAISLSAVLGNTEQPEAIINQQEALKRLEARGDALVLYQAEWQQTREAQAIVFHLTSMFNNAETHRIEVGSFIKLYGSGPVCEAVAGKFKGIADGQ